MENKKNGCGCGGNKLTKHVGDKSMPTSPKPIEIRAGKGTMTRVGNQIEIPPSAFPNLANAAERTTATPQFRASPTKPIFAAGNGYTLKAYQSFFLTDHDVPIAGAGLSHTWAQSSDRFVGIFQVSPESEEKPLKGPGNKPWPQGITRIGPEPKDSDFKDYDAFSKWLSEQLKKDEGKGRGEPKIIKGVALEGFYDDPLGDAPPPNPLEDIKCGESQIYQSEMTRHFKYRLCSQIRLDTKVKDSDNPKDPVKRSTFADLEDSYKKEAKLECERQLKDADGSSTDIEKLRRRAEQLLNSDGVADPAMIADILMPLKRAADSMDCTPNPDKCEKRLDIVYYRFTYVVYPVVYQYDVSYEHADATQGQENYQALVDVYFSVKLNGWIWFKISCVN